MTCKWQRIAVVSLALTGMSPVWGLDEVKLNYEHWRETTPVAEESLGAVASVWGLKPEEYRHYEHLMKDTPAGKWWPHLDPVEVLGFMAETTQEQEHYAELNARMRKQMTEVAIRFGQQTSAAYERLWPNMKPIMTQQELQAAEHGVSPVPLLMKDDELLVFVNADEQGIALLGTALEWVRVHQAKVHVYVMGKVDGKAIQRLAAAAQIPRDWVKQGLLTLNHDNGRAAQMLGDTAGEPAIVRNRYGQMEKLDASLDLARR